MHLDKEIVRMDRRPDGLSMRPDDSNTLTRQSTVTNDVPRDPLLSPIEWDPDLHGPEYVYFYGYVYSTARYKDHHKQQTLRRYVNSLPIVASYPPLYSLSSASAVFSRFNGYNSIQSKVFDWN